MSNDSSDQAPGYKATKSAELRERRKAAGVTQMSFVVREEDKAEIARIMRDFTDFAWLSLYDAELVINGANEHRAADIRKRLEAKATRVCSPISGHQPKTED